jgi:thiol:disulfide interchange protein
VVFSLALLTSAAVAQGSYVPVRAYDPSRNAERDVAEAQAEAKRTGKNVLVEVGGKWCVWCRNLEKFFDQHADIAALRDKGFVTIAVNFSPENKNAALLGRYPKIPGYPHLFVLNAEGKLLHSQNTSELEEGRGYNAKKVEAFLLKWAPAAVAGNVSHDSAK